MKKYLTKRNIIFTAINLLLLILIGLCLWKCSVYSNTLLSQQAAEVWRGESKERFAQVSCFLPETAKTDVNSIRSFQKKIDQKLAEAGVEQPEEGQLWADAYSVRGTVQVSGDKGSSAATAVGVGGDFFLFHPYYLMSGSYIYPDDIMQDRVVIDSDLAWKLFGSSSLEGMTLEINGTPYYITGVVQRENDKFTQKAFSQDPLIFMSQAAYEHITEDSGIDCYELVMLDPISDYAKTVVKENFPVGNGEVVSNSTRYDFSAIFGIFKNFGSRVMRTVPVALPYWENAARLSEEYIARLWVIMAILGLFPLVCLVWLLVLLFKWLSKKLGQGAAAAKEAWEDRYGRMEECKQRRLARRRKKAGLEGEAPGETGEQISELAQLPIEESDDTLEYSEDDDSAFREFFSAERTVEKKHSKREKHLKEKKPRRKRGYRPPEILESFENPFAEENTSQSTYDED